MSGPSLGGAPIAAVEQALRGLEVRGNVRAHNVANVNTPGFRAQRVDFETSLRSAIAQGDPARAGEAEVLPGAGLPDAHGNTVDLEEELVGMMKDNMLRDAMVAGFNYKVGLLRTVIGGR